MGNVRIRTQVGIYGKIWPKPWGSDHILPYIPPLVLIRIQYTFYSISCTSSYYFETSLEITSMNFTADCKNRKIIFRFCGAVKKIKRSLMVIINVLWREEGYTMKYCLSPRDFLRAQAIFHRIP